MQKHEQIEGARTEFARLMDAIESMDEYAMTTPGMGEWGVREVLAHITGWTLIDTEILRRLGRGERPLREGEEYGTGDSRNPGFASAAAPKSAANVIAELRAAFDEFVAVAETLPEERFQEGRTVYRLMRDSAQQHLSEHCAEIESYRSMRAKA
ncbi:MAG: maleylpyruvate isomerase N-terminal domain-containing protein [Dehalococcoidia bacterium]